MVASFSDFVLFFFFFFLLVRMQVPCFFTCGYVACCKSYSYYFTGCYQCAVCFEYKWGVWTKFSFDFIDVLPHFMLFTEDSNFPMWISEHFFAHIDSFLLDFL